MVWFLFYSHQLWNLFLHLEKKNPVPPICSFVCIRAQWNSLFSVCMLTKSKHWFISQGRLSGHVVVGLRIPPNSPATFSSKIQTNPTVCSPESPTVWSESCLTNYKSPPFWLRVAVFLPAWPRSVQHGSSSSSLGPLVAPVSSSAPGRGDRPAPLDPCTNYFQSSWDLDHSRAGASGATAPREGKFFGFLSSCHEVRLQPWTWIRLNHQGAWETWQELKKLTNLNCYVVLDLIVNLVFFSLPWPVI